MIKPKKILVIGPASVGKSTICKMIARDPSIQYYNLDCLITTFQPFVKPRHALLYLGEKAFAAESKRIIEEEIKVKPFGVTLVDVSSASILHPSIHPWLLKQNTILITGPERQIYRRWVRRNQGYNYPAFLQREFSPERKRLYNSPHKGIIYTSGRSATQVAEDLKNMIRRFQYSAPLAGA